MKSVVGSEEIMDVSKGWILGGGRVGDKVRGGGLREEGGVSGCGGDRGESVGCGTGDLGHQLENERRGLDVAIGGNCQCWAAHHLSS